MNIMKMELAASGMSEEEILAKAQLLMKAFGKEDTASTAEFKLLSKQKNKALVKAEIPPKDFTAVSIFIFFYFGLDKIVHPSVLSFGAKILQTFWFFFASYIKAFLIN